MVSNTIHEPTARVEAYQTACGELLTLIYEAMKSLTPGQVLEVISDDAGAREDLPSWCNLTRNPLLRVEQPADSSPRTCFWIQKGAPKS